MAFSNSENNQLCKADLKVYVSLKFQFWFVKKWHRSKGNMGIKNRLQRRTWVSCQGSQHLYANKNQCTSRGSFVTQILRPLYCYNVLKIHLSDIHNSVISSPVNSIEVIVSFCGQLTSYYCDQNCRIVYSLFGGRNKPNIQ